jgi:hypothetical protein
MNETFQYVTRAFAKDNVLKADIKKLRVVIKNSSCTVSDWKPLSGFAPVRKRQKELDSGAHVHFRLRAQCWPFPNGRRLLQ